MKIVVPIMPTSLEEAQALELSRFEGADIIEWRADFLDKDSILTVAPAIFEKFAGFEIIFTIRTMREGGRLELTDAEYVALIKDVAAIYSPDYITRKAVFDQMLEFSNLVLSYHNFEETPENLMELLSEMANLTPRVVKVAVVPKNEQDVLDLMNFTRGFKAFNPEQEFVTMSMGKLGRLSRFAGDLIGSSWTFASLDNASAPGQISLADMRRIREVLDAD